MTRHVFVFNSEDNGGEALSLTTEAVRHVDGDFSHLAQKITLQSYGRCAVFEVYDLTPEKLRRCADALESYLAPV